MIRGKRDFIIGFLSCVCLMLLISANDQPKHGEFDTLKVRKLDAYSISMENSISEKMTIRPNRIDMTDTKGRKATIDVGSGIKLENKESMVSLSSGIITEMPRLD